MSQEWTDSQKLALSEGGGNYLISAGAGSGKTTVMTEKIKRYLLNHPETDMTRLLIVTFTRAAALELKERLAQSLKKAMRESENKQPIYRQLLSMDRACITTISSFCLRILRMRPAELGLAPDFKVADETEAEILRREAMEETVEEGFSRWPEATERMASFGELAFSFGSAREEAALDETLLTLVEKMREKGLTPDSLRRFAEERDEQAKAGGYAGPDAETVGSLVAETAEYYETLFRRFQALFEDDLPVQKAYGSVIDHLIENSGRLKKASRTKDYEAIKCMLENIPKEKLDSLSSQYKTKESVLFTKEKTQFYEDMDKIREDYFSKTPHAIADNARETARYERTAAAVYERFLEHYQERKRKKGILDYSDLEMEALRLLTDDQGAPSAFARDVSEMFDQIFVDEYQDTNMVQDSIFRAIERNHNRFLVGDIKQSIYGFRGAEPDTFSNYRKIWKSDGSTQDRSIFMSENFRCSDPIIRFTNLVSDAVFPASSLDYSEMDHLIHKKEDTEMSPVRIHIVKKTEEEEARAVAREIQSLLQEKKPDGTPAYRAGDIAILLRGPMKKANIFVKALKAAGIPTCKKEKLDFFSQPEIHMMLCLLQTINNPTRDIPLTGFLKSPLGGMSLDEVTRMRKPTRRGNVWNSLGQYAEHGEERELRDKCRSLKEKINQYREIAKGMPSDKMIQYLMEDSRIMDHVTRGREKPEQIQHHLMSLYEMARLYESENFEGLYGFLKYLEKQKQDNDLSFPLSGKEESGVRILSIHESKGLEFPVVFLCRTASSFNHMDEQDRVLLDRCQGISMILPDASGTVRIDTWQRNVMRYRIRVKDLEEEMRILYVALTRARERLFVFGTDKDGREAIASSQTRINVLGQGQPMTTLPRFWVMKSASMLKWILFACCFRGEKEYIVFPAGEEEAEMREHPEEMPESETVGTDLTENGLSEEVLKARLHFEYPLRYLENIPVKMIVSKLHPGVIDASEEEGVWESREASAPGSGKETMKESPSFLMPELERKAAEAGTATHAFLEFCRFDELEKDDGIEKELDRLVKEEFLSPSMAALVNRENIRRFVASGLFTRMRKAKRIEREFSFYALLPADGLTNREEWKEQLRNHETQVMIQGVVDCFFEEEDGTVVLVDYKTDFLTCEERADYSLAAAKLTERHRHQLLYYRMACEKMMNRKVNEVLIYSVPYGDVFPI